MTWTLIGFVSGMLFGIFISAYFIKGNIVGNLIITDDVDEETYMYLKITQYDMDELRRKSVVRLKIIDKNG